MPSKQQVMLSEAMSLSDMHATLRLACSAQDFVHEVFIAIFCFSQPVWMIKSLFVAMQPPVDIHACQCEVLAPPTAEACTRLQRT